MNQYETVFIITPVLSEDEIKKSIEKYRNFVKDSGGEIINDEHWGLKQLAYPIKKKTTGVYHVLEFKADAPVIEKLEIAYNRDENVLRYLTTVLDKFSIAYSERRRSGKNAKDNEAKAAVVEAISSGSQEF